MNSNQQITAALRASGLSRDLFAKKLAASLKREGVDITISAVFAWLRPTTSNAYRVAPRIAAIQAERL